MTAALDGARIALLVVAATVVHVTVVGGIELAGGGPDLLLVTLVAIALLRGPVAGAAAGFLGGLVADTATLGTLGLTSLLLTVAGYWIGRYGETSAAERAHAPLLAVGAVTVLYALGGIVLHFVLGDAVAAGAVLRGMFAAIAFNALLSIPVVALVRRALGTPSRDARTAQVELLGG